MKIAHYEVVERLGAGGMGEVYRAQDPKLGRDVAIKVLPAAFLQDPDRRARFEREARVLASINHPHIGAIYGVEEADGYRALVLELVEGQTLAERIAGSGRLALEDALPIARQIAEALEAAHEKGIVHREPQAGQRHGDRGRRGEGGRLRPRQVRSRRGLRVGAREFADAHLGRHPRRSDRRHRGLSQPRTGAWTRHRQTQRHLGIRMRPL